MAKISIQPDCCNSPTKGFLKDRHVNIANGNLEALLVQIPENISWDRVGLASVADKLEFVTSFFICLHPGGH